jgi:hypothetical protein
MYIDENTALEILFCIGWFGFINISLVTGEGLVDVRTTILILYLTKCNG